MLNTGHATNDTARPPAAIVSHPKKLPQPPATKESSARGGRGRTGLAAVSPTAGLLSLRSKAPPELKEAQAQGAEWLKRRVREYVQAHGVCGVGVCALLERASSALAWSWWLEALASAGVKPDGTPVDHADVAKRSQEMAVFARQQELAAFEICAREGKAARASRSEANPLAAAQKASKGAK